jgi:hypothetical protein
LRQAYERDLNAGQGVCVIYIEKCLADGLMQRPNICIVDPGAKPQCQVLLVRQVRGDHAEVVQLLVQLGGKVRATSGALVDLQTTPLSR